MRRIKALILSALITLFYITSYTAVYAFEFPPPPTLEPTPSGRELFVQGELLVKFKAEATEDKKKKVHDKLGSEKLYEFDDHLTHHVKLKKKLEVEDAVELYEAEPEVEYAEPNYLFYPQAEPSNNPLYSRQWNLAPTKINAPGAWDFTTGSPSVVVGVIDSGIDYTHEDFYNNVTDMNTYNIWTNPLEWYGVDNQDDDLNTYIDDDYGINTYLQPEAAPHDTMDTTGHGTHVSGIIGAVAGNDRGVVGLNWDVKILPCRAGAGFGFSASSLIKCFDYLKNISGLVAINASWGSPDDSLFTWNMRPGIKTVHDSINSMPNVLLVAAAGNAGEVNVNKKLAEVDNDKFPQYPANYDDLPNVISVGATDEMDDRGTWTYSDNYFESCYGRRSVHIAAPGINILSTLPATNNFTGLTCEPEVSGQQGKYCYLSGTSMAAPHVTGLAALLKAQDSLRTAPVIKKLILAGGDTLPSSSTMYGKTITNKRINAYGSLNCTNSPVFSALNPKNRQYNPDNSIKSVDLSALSFNCANSIGPVTVTPSGGMSFNLDEETVTLDDSPDTPIGTGKFSGTWLTSTLSATDLTFSSPAGSETFYAPTVTSVTPSSGSQLAGAPQTFIAVYNDANGAEDITGAWIGLSSGTLANSIIVHYGRTDNTLKIYNDDGTDWNTTSCVLDPHSTATISNSQGIVDCAKTTVTTNGDQLTVNWSITPTNSFTSEKNIYLLADDALLNSGIIQQGPWTITSVKSLSITKSGSGTGTVTSMPSGINCGTTCTGSFAAGTVVTLTAASDANSAFAG